MKLSFSSLSFIMGAVTLSTSGSGRGFVEAIPQVTVADIVAANSARLSILQDALIDLGVFEQLNDADIDATVFAPINSAFTALPNGLATNIFKEQWTDHLITLLGLHFSEDVIPSSAIENGTVHEDEFDLGANRVFTIDKDGDITIAPGGAMIIEKDLMAINGFVHILDGIITPDFVQNSIYDIAKGNANFTELVKLIDMAGLQSTLSTLGASGPFTLLAPTNDGIANLLKRKPWIESKLSDADYLEDFLLYHVLNGIVKGVDFEETTNVTALNGKLINVKTTVNNNYELVVRLQDATTSEDTTLAHNGHVYNLDNAITPYTVVDVVMQNDDLFGTLLRLGNASGLGDVLDCTANLTVFAPVDSAFAKLPAALVTQLLTPEFISHLKSVLQNHIVAGSVVESSMLTDGAMLKAMNEEILSFSVDAMGGITINNNATNVIANLTDIPTQNPAIIHGIDSVLTPGWLSTNVLEVATAAGNFDTLIDLVGNFDDLVAALTGTDGVTVFAPNDAAFTKLSTDFPAEFAVIQNRTEVLEAILSAHIVNGVITTEQLNEGSTVVNTLNGESLTVVKTGSAVTVNGVAVIAADVLASNGVIHELGSVLDSSTFPLDSLVPSPPTGSPTDAPTSAPTSAAFKPAAFVHWMGLAAGAVAGMLAM